MMGLIGFADEVIGFGLAGVSKTIELTKKADEEKIMKAILTMQEDVSAIIINESLMNQVRDKKNLPNLIYIEIPTNLESISIDKIESLTKETLGIALQER